MKKLMMSAAAVVAALSAGAAVKLAPVFGDKMVLQREKPVRVWGTAEAGEKVTVAFGCQKKCTVADEKGAWRLELDAMPACRKGRELVVKGSRPAEAGWLNGFGLWASDRVTSETRLKDVLVGEVWFCSGQSNTDCPIWGGSPRYREGQGALTLQMTKRPLIRLVKTPLVWSATPKLDVTAQWLEMSPDLFEAKIRLPSAMGYHFALELYGALEIPVGLVDCSWGGTNIDAWTPPCGTKSRPELADIAKLPLLERQAFEAARKKGGVYSGPNMGIFGRPQQQPAALWNGMVAAYAPMSIRGFIWYQGCHNSGEPQRYCSKMHALYNGWAKAFDNPDLKLYFVQLTPWGAPSIPYIQEAQAQFAAEEPNAGMAVINDVGNLHDIHPNDKRTVAKRLAALALARDYGYTKLRADSPVLKGWKIEGDTFRLSFDHAQGWYIYNNDRSVKTGFEIAGADGVFKPAVIVNLVPADKRGHYSGNIVGAELRVRADGVKEPKKLRYLYSAPWFGCLYNESCLPLGAFHIGD